MKAKRIVLTALRHCFSGNYRLIRSLRAFDPGYYLGLSGKDAQELPDPLWDYLKWKGEDYIDEDLLTSGWKQLKDPHFLFDTAFYLNRYFISEDKRLRMNPFVHYLRIGWKKGYKPGPFLDPVVYAKRSNWSTEAGDPLTHYTHHSMAGGVSPSLDFDIDFYMDRNPALASIRGEILRHYKLFGAKIGRSPLPCFDPAYYLDRLDDRNCAAADPYSHYITTAGDSTRPAEFFDPGFYADQCDLAGEELTKDFALAHYVTEGVHRGYYIDERVRNLSKKPLVSIVVPVYNPDLNFLGSCIRSVLYQAYPHWELCLVDDCSTSAGVREALEQWAARDSRISFSCLQSNSGIAAATNAAISLAGGEYIGFLDNDDELSGDALYQVVDNIGKTGAELVYSDEDLIGDDSSRLSVFRKPAFNDGLLLSHNYITHFVVASKRLLQEVGGLESKFDGAQDYDLLLKLTEKTTKISHIPKVLYHWRASHTSTSINHDEKNYAHSAGRMALGAALRRRAIAAQAADTDLNFYYRFTPERESMDKAAVFLWVPDALAEYFNSLRLILSETRYEGVRFVVVAPQGEVGLWLDGVCDSIGEIGDGILAENIIQFPVSRDLPKAEGLHQAIEATECDWIAFVELPLQSIHQKWLEELRNCFLIKDTAVACGRIRYNGKDGRSYTLPDMEDDSARYYSYFLQYHSRHVNGMHCFQEVPCCGWDMVMMRKRTYLESGGFNHVIYPSFFPMVDLAMRMRETGAKICYTPFAEADSGQGATNGDVQGDNGLEGAEEKKIFQREWRHGFDPFEHHSSQALLDDNDIDRKQFLTWLTG